MRLLVIWLLLGVAQAAPPIVGIVSDLRGTVERRPGPEGVWKPAELDEGLAIRDAVLTREKSSAELTFVDGTVLALGERTRMAISLILFDPAEAPVEIQVALLMGVADITAGRFPLVVETPQGRTTVPAGQSAAFSVDGPPVWLPTVQLPSQGRRWLPPLVGPDGTFAPDRLPEPTPEALPDAAPDAPGDGKTRIRVRAQPRTP